jgi:hypothetical protein
VNWGGLLAVNSTTTDEVDAFVVKVNVESFWIHGTPKGTTSFALGQN